MKRNLVIFLFLSVFPLLMVAQKEAVNWYFGEKAGVDFNSGNPVALLNGASSSQFGGTSCISDSSGAIMFYTNGDTVWNKNHLVMTNGLGIGGDWLTSQAALIVPLPGSSSVYYIFTVGSKFSPKGLCYSTINMNLDGGLGQVVLKNVPVQGAPDANIFLTATKHSNNKDWWIIVRRLNNDKYASFLLTSSGLITTPIYSSTRYVDLQYTNNGQMKISPNRTLLVASFFRVDPYEGTGIEVSRFNTTTGKVDYKFLLSIWHTHNYGIEFSPDSKLLYVAYSGIDSNPDSNAIYQYKISDVDSLPIISSGISIARTVNDMAELQLASDGVIYLSGDQPNHRLFLSAIKDPWKVGQNCNYQTNSFWLGNRYYREALPNFPQEFLYRFVWSGGPCAGVPFKFQHHFLPEPDTVIWEFGDPGSGSANTSYAHNPVHIFSTGGIFEVFVYAHYPDGRIEETSRKIKVIDKPFPNLGPDTLVCLGASVSLTPGSGFTGYYWNGSIMPGSPSYMTNDTGTYIVRVKNDLGCYNSDTIKVLLRPAPFLDESNLNIAPTTCSGTTGAITGLQVIGQPPFSYQWTTSGIPLSNSLDIYHLGTGLYELSVTDCFGCTYPAASYAINDAGYILIETASVTPSYCGNDDGTFMITAVSGLGSMLQYFIKSGNDTLSQWFNGQFTYLKPGTYYCWVSDSSGCSSYYSSSLVITNLPAPLIISVTSTPETGTASDGTITVIASGIGLTYSLNGSLPVNNSSFTGLTTGLYSIKVSNPAGCDTTFSILVGHESGIRLSAIAGNGSTCLGKVARVPLLVNNFKDVQAFGASLNYEKLFVTCIGYIPNPLPQLADSLDVTLFPSTGIIRATWKGGSPLTLVDSSELLQLVFTSILPGNAILLWDVSPSVSYFSNQTGDTLLVDYEMGKILIYDPPLILSTPFTKVCEGEELYLPGIVQNGTGLISYRWLTPNSIITGIDNIDKTATLDDEGLYQLIATDTVNCADTATMTVVVIPTPVSGFTNDTVYFDEQTHLEAAQGYNSYAWNTGDSTYSILVTSEGWYKVTMKTPEGCTSTDSIMMLYSFAPFTLPNAFSPNGDGKNEVFRPVTVPEKISSFTMYLYNRWGQQVYATKDLGTGWDGTINGSPAPMGVYTFIISYSNAVGESRKKNGTVTLVR